MKKGIYIVIEGGEGSGKTTQAKLLSSYLSSKGFPSVYLREPGSVQVSEKIRKILLDKRNIMTDLTELLLFEAARTEFFDKKVILAIESEKIVVADRSGISTKAYQGYGKGLDLKLIDRLNREATYGFNPDLAIIIDIQAEKGLAKELAQNRISAQGIEFHTRVNQGYRQMAEDNQDTMVLIKYLENDIEGMQEQIRKIAMNRLDLK